VVVVRGGPVVEVVRGAAVPAAVVVALSRDAVVVDESSPPHATAAEATNINNTARVRLFMADDHMSSGAAPPDSAGATAS
jgi:hypothetical protein